MQRYDIAPSRSSVVESPRMSESLIPADPEEFAAVVLTPDTEPKRKRSVHFDRESITSIRMDEMSSGRVSVPSDDSDALLPVKKTAPDFRQRLLERIQKESGLLYMVLSTVLFCFLGMAVKAISVSSEPIPTMEIIVFRGFTGYVISVCMMFYQGVPHIWTGPPGITSLLFLRGLTGFIALSLGWWTLTILSVADATVLGFLAPVFTGMFSRLFLDEAWDLPDAIAGLFSLVGVVFIARPTFIFGSTFLQKVIVVPKISSVSPFETIPINSTGRGRHEIAKHVMSRIYKRSISKSKRWTISRDEFRKTFTRDHPSPPASSSDDNSSSHDNDFPGIEDDNGPIDTTISTESMTRGQEPAPILLGDTSILSGISHFSKRDFSANVTDIVFNNSNGTLEGVGDDPVVIEPIVPTTDDSLRLAGVCSGLLSAVFVGFAFIIIRKLSINKNCHSLHVVSWFHLLSIPFGILMTPILPTSIESHPWIVPTHITTYLLLFSTGVAGLIGQLLMSLALSREKAGKAAAMNYIQAVFAFLFEYLFWGIKPHWMSLLGGGIVVLCVIMVAVFKKPKPS